MPSSRLVSLSSAWVPITSFGAGFNKTSSKNSRLRGTIQSKERKTNAFSNSAHTDFLNVEGLAWPGICQFQVLHIDLYTESRSPDILIGYWTNKSGIYQIILYQSWNLKTFLIWDFIKVDYVVLIVADSSWYNSTARQNLPIGYTKHHVPIAF